VPTGSGTSGGPLTVTVQPNSGQTARSATLTLTAGSATTPVRVQQGGADECGDTVATACVWPFRSEGSDTTVWKAALQTFDDIDYFKFTVDQTDQYHFEIQGGQPGKSQVHMGLWDSGLHWIDSDNSYTPFSATLSPGTYYLRVGTYQPTSSEAPGPYTVTITRTGILSITNPGAALSVEQGSTRSLQIAITNTTGKTPVFSIWALLSTNLADCVAWTSMTNSGVASISPPIGAYPGVYTMSVRVDANGMSTTATYPITVTEPAVATSPKAGIVPTKGGSIDFVVKARDTTWSMSGQPSWVHPSVTTGPKGISTVTLTVDPLAGAASRYTTITFTSGAATATYTLDQTDATGVAFTISRLVRSIMATLLDMIKKLLPLFATLG